MATGSGDVSAVYDILYNSNYTPRSSPSAHIESLIVDGKPSFVLTKESTKEYYDVDPTTHAIWLLLDGKRTVKEIYDELRPSDDKLTENDVRDVVVSLAEEGVIESTEREVHKGKVELVSAFQLNVRLVKDSSESFARLFRITRKLVRRVELPIGIAIAIAGFFLFYASFVHIFTNTAILNVAGSALLGFFVYQMVVLLPVYAVHELAHAAVCDYYGGKPGEIGTGLYYLAPFFYCDTSDAWRLSRRARIMISAAGPLSTVVISAFFVFSSYFAAGPARDVLQIAAFFGFYGSLTNFSPVIETDGYYILADVLRIPNLRDEAFSYVKRSFLGRLGRPITPVRQSAREKRVVAVYTIFMVAWLIFFGYTTAWLLGVYGVSAYLASSSLVSILLGVQSPQLTMVAVDTATLAYFAFFMAGYVVMGVVAYRKIRMKGVKLVTIHNKRVSAFLPLPSDLDRSQSSGLVESSRKLARKYAHFSNVTLQPPICVAELKLGRVDQSMEALWSDMREIEDSFRSLHRKFLSAALARRESAVAARKLEVALIEFAGNLAPSQRHRAVSSVSRFVEAQNDRVSNVLQAAFGTVWTLGFPPDDYKKIRRGMFSSLIAEDLSVTDLPSGVEDFKLRRVVGLDALATLSSEMEAESKDVYKRPELYQTTVFIEPVRSRLVFVGRTDNVEGSVVWLGGLYLYQAWTSYMVDALEEAAVGLKSIRLSHPVPLTKTQAAKVRLNDLETIKRAFDQLPTLQKTVTEAMEKIESTFESASNFHEMLASLVTDGSFDIGLYRPILNRNEAHLKGVSDKIGEFRREFAWVSKRLESSRDAIGEIIVQGMSQGVTNRSIARRIYGSISTLWEERAVKGPSEAYETEVKLIFAATRMVYGIVVGSDVIL